MMIFDVLQGLFSVTFLAHEMNSDCLRDDFHLKSNLRREKVGVVYEMNY
jgi:hypothetical protein